MKFQHIPVNLIVGFLGVGKTSAIRSLLESTRDQIRWGVLVNEFGKVGIDGSLLENSGATIKEVPGGCLCCAASASLSVGLNELIRRGRPERLLIEPTGLGHPARVIELLTTPHYQGVLEVRATVGLLDARQLAEARYREHVGFREQLQVADVLVANKLDRYQDTDRQAFEAYAARLRPPKARLAFTTQGRLSPDWLDLPRDPDRARPMANHGHGAEHCELPTPADHSWQFFEQHEDGAWGGGWVFENPLVLDFSALKDWLGGLDMQRIKGIVPTSEGWKSLNRSGEEGGWQGTDPRPQGRLEMVSLEPRDWAGLDRQLRALSVPRPSPAEPPQTPAG